MCASSAAQADVLTFEQPIAQPLIFNDDVLTFGEYSVTAVNEVGGFAGFVGKNDAFAGPQNPVNNPTTYYTAFDDSYLFFAKTDNSMFKIKSFDASFIGAGLATYPSVSAVLYLAGFNGSTLVAEKQFDLAGPTNGNFNFATFDVGTFSNLEFTNVLVAAFACDAAGACNRETNQANFALDNVVTFVPEPGSFALFGLGLLGLGAVARRRA